MVAAIIDACHIGNRTLRPWAHPYLAATLPQFHQEAKRGGLAFILLLLALRQGKEGLRNKKYVVFDWLDEMQLSQHAALGVVVALTFPRTPSSSLSSCRGV